MKRRRLKKPKDESWKRGVSDVEAQELKAIYGNGGVFIPAPGLTVVTFFRKPKDEKKP